MPRREAERRAWPMVPLLTIVGGVGDTSIKDDLVDVEFCNAQDDFGQKGVGDGLVSDINRAAFAVAVLQPRGGCIGADLDWRYDFRQFQRQELKLGCHSDRTGVEPQQVFLKSRLLERDPAGEKICCLSASTSAAPLPGRPLLRCPRPATATRRGAAACRTLNDLWRQREPRLRRATALRDKLLKECLLFPEHTFDLGCTDRGMVAAGPRKEGSSGFQDPGQRRQGPSRSASCAHAGCCCCSVMNAFTLGRLAATR